MPETVTRRSARRTRKRSRTPRRNRRRVQNSSVGRSGLPSWKDLPGEHEPDPLTRRSTTGFVLTVVLLASALTAYIGHVQSTQQLIVNLQQERSENQHLHMRLERLKGEFDRATGPAVIYDRAAQIGLQEGGAPMYQLDPPSR